MNGGGKLPRNVRIDQLKSILSLECHNDAFTTRGSIVDTLAKNTRKTSESFNGYSKILNYYL